MYSQLIRQRWLRRSSKVKRAGFTEQDLHPVSERLVESLLVSGSEARIRERVLELLETPIDALALGLVPVSDAIQERIRLARLIGRL